MTLFTVGPVEMHSETLEVAGKQLPYFRTDEFSEITLDSERLMKKFAGAAEQDKVVFLTASGTGAMETAVMNCLTPQDRALVISGGSFGKRFCEMCKVHEIPFDSIDLKFGEALTQDTLDRYDGRGYTALLVNIHETSTGQLYDVGMLSRFCKKNRMIFIVDAISSFLADDLNFTRDGMDVMIVSSQKALSLSPGLSILVLSERVIKGRVERGDPKCVYFDLKSYLDNAKRGQTPFTPAVGILLELNNMLHMIDVEGADNKRRNTEALAHYFRESINNLPLSIPDYPLSNAVTPIIFHDGGAFDVHLKLMRQKNVVLTPNGGDLRNKVLRVSHIGNLHKNDYDNLINILKEELQ